MTDRRSGPAVGWFITVLAFASGAVMPPAAGIPAEARAMTPLETCLARVAGAAGCLLGRGPGTFDRTPLGQHRAGGRATSPDCALAGIDDRCERWSATYDNPSGYTGGGSDQTTDVAAGNARVYVTGGSWDDGTGHYDIATVAYDQATGARTWAARHDGQAGGFDAAYGVEVDPHEGTVYVAGTCDDDRIAIVAHDAATGAERWSTCWQRHEGEPATAYALALDRTGTRLYAAGKLGEAVGVVAVDTATGETIWDGRWGQPASLFDIALDVAVAPDGRRVYVTGISAMGGGAIDYATAAFRAAIDDPEDRTQRLGQVLWAATHDDGTGGNDQAFALAVDPTDRHVVVTGLTQRGDPQPWSAAPVAATTIAYRTDDGSRTWIARHEPTPLGRAPQAAGTAITVSEDGARAFIAGISSGTTSEEFGFHISAYAVEDGAHRWTSRYQPPGSTYGVATSVATSDDGSRVYAAGPSFLGAFTYKGDVATVAHETATGRQVWAARFTRIGDDVADLLPYPAFIAASPGGVFISGTYINYHADADGPPKSFSDYWTMGYDS